jgi:hypothetical protein
MKKCRKPSTEQGRRRGHILSPGLLGLALRPTKCATFVRTSSRPLSIRTIDDVVLDNSMENATETLHSRGLFSFFLKKGPAEGDQGRS